MLKVLRQKPASRPTEANKKPLAGAKVLKVSRKPLSPNSITPVSLKAAGN